MMDDCYGRPTEIAILPKLRQGARKGVEPKAQPLLETSAAVVEGLIIAFDDDKKKNEVKK
jgi:hypothetical protein